MWFKNGSGIKSDEKTPVPKKHFGPFLNVNFQNWSGPNSDKKRWFDARCVIFV